MADVLIRECTVRVVRRGGWSWGPSPRDLLAAVLEAAPALIAAKLDRILSEDASGIVREPITIRIPVRLSDLVTAGGSQRSAQSIAAELASRLEPHVETEFERITIEPEPASASRHAAAETRAADAPVRSRRYFARYLLTLAREKTLAGVLERLPPETIAVWHGALFLKASSAASLPAAELLRELPQDLVAALDAIGRPLAARVPGSRRNIAEIALAALLAERTGRQPDDAEVAAAVFCLRQSLDQEPPGRGSALPQAGAEQLPGHAAPPTGGDTAITPPRRDDSGEAVPADVRFGTAMMWLALAPLHRAGLLDAVAAQFEAARMEADLPVFAAAFAAKYLECPEPRWKHETAWRTAISAFAGGRHVIADDQLTGLPRRCRTVLPALWAALQNALLKEWRAGAPLLLLPVSGGYALTDPEGSLLLSAAGSVTGLLAAITLAPGSPVVIDHTCIAAADTLAELGIACVTLLKPRGSGGWHSVPLGQGRTLWATGALLSPKSQAECAEALDRADQVRQNCSYFVAERQAAPRAVDLAFEAFTGALAMAATAALAPEPADPLSVLDYYRGFDALAELREDRIRIRMPLGRRYLNLERAGWLSPLRHVPWLEPRYVEFSRG